MNHGKQRFDRCSDEHHCPAKMPHFDAYESMGKLADIGYHCVEISQVPMTAENVAGFRKAIDDLGLNVSSLHRIHLSHAARYARRVPVNAREL